MSDPLVQTTRSTPPTRSWLDSVQDALRGIGVMFRTQRNARIQAVLFVGVVVLSLILRITLAEWAVVLLVSGLVFATEALNTAVEELANEISREIRPGLGRAKDVAAGATLLASIFAAAVGVTVFLPRLIALVPAISK